MWSNFKAEWISWWRTTSWLARLLPLAVIATHIGIQNSLGSLGLEDVLFASAFFVTFYLVPGKRTPFGFFLPLYCGWLLHVAFQYIPAGTVPHFTGKESLEIDRSFLSVPWQEKSVTVGEFLALWINPDFAKSFEVMLYAVPFLVVGFSAALRFYYSTKGTKRYSAWGIDTLSPQMNWAIVMVWFASHLGFPSVHVALMTVAAYYGFKFGVQRSSVAGAVILTSILALISGQAYAVDVIFGIVEGLLFSSVADMIAYQRPRRDAQKVWNPSIEKPTPPVRKRAS